MSDRSSWLEGSKNGCPTVFPRGGRVDCVACGAGARACFGERHAGPVGARDGVGIGSAVGGTRNCGFGGSLRYEVGTKRRAVDRTDFGRCDVRRSESARCGAVGALQGIRPGEMLCVRGQLERSLDAGGCWARGGSESLLEDGEAGTAARVECFELARRKKT